MANTTQFDTATDSNDYFFVGGIKNSTFTAGKNSFTINPSAKITETITSNNISVFDPSGNKLSVFNLIPNGSTGYQYTEGTSQVFGVLVYPTTVAGVGRIEITATGTSISVTSSAGLGDDERWAVGQYTNGPKTTDAIITWTKAIKFSPQSANESDAHFFDFPELIAKTEIYDIRSGDGCMAVSSTGECSSVASTPKNASGADYNYNTVDVIYTINRTSGSAFESSMDGSMVRFTNIITVDRTLNVDFVARIKKVLTENSLLVDRPMLISKQMLNGLVSEDTPYIEETGTDIKKYDTFNETDMYSTTAKSSGVQLIQSQQVYATGFSGVAHRKNYIVTNIKSANFEIIHIPRSTSMVVSGIKVCVANLELINLRTLTGAVDRYRVIKRSLNIPESRCCIAEGILEPRELIFDWFAGEDYASLGKFYNLSFSQTYWLTSGGVSYDYTPQTLIDSITIRTSGAANVDETNYIILKNNRGEPGRTSAYVPYTPITGSWWGTDSDRFVNFATEPTTSYNCALTSPYLNSVEVVKTGAAFNSNFIKLVKNTMYEFSMAFSALASANPTNYSVDVYFITTRGNSPLKIKIGSLNTKTTRGFNFGTYSTKIFIPRTMFGTIQLVPKYVTSVAISNISLKQFTDVAYPMDSAEVIVPLTTKVKNERIELTVELMDSVGRLVYGDGASAFGNNIALRPLRDIVIADPI